MKPETDNIAFGYTDREGNVNIVLNEEIPHTGGERMMYFNVMDSVWLPAFLRAEAFRALSNARPGEEVKSPHKWLRRMTEAELAETIKRIKEEN